jgi:hypothetical protein
MSLVNTSVDDIRSTLKCNEPQYSADYLQAELKKEMREQNRRSVISLLEAAIKRKVKSKK